MFMKSGMTQILPARAEKLDSLGAEMTQAMVRDVKCKITPRNNDQPYTSLVNCIPTSLAKTIIDGYIDPH